jgi:hypothetical protein
MIARKSVIGKNPRKKSINTGKLVKTKLISTSLSPNESSLPCHQPFFDTKPLSRYFNKTVNGHAKLTIKKFNFCRVAVL